MIRNQRRQAMSKSAVKRKNTELEDLAYSVSIRLEHLWKDIKYPLFWSCAATISLSLLVYFSVTRTGGERLALLPYEMQDVLQKRQPGSSFSAALEQKLGQIRQENTQLVAARTKLEQRVTQLEENYSDITASIPKRSPALGAATSPITQSVQVSPMTAKIPAPATPASSEITTGSLTIATRSQFGIDLGTDHSMGALRTRWIKLMEQFGTIMTGYEPVISVSDAQGAVMLHLVVGPFSNAAEAAEICAKLRTAGMNACTPVPYDGQRLALR
jgi:cell division protein FtsB